MTYNQKLQSVKTALTGISKLKVYHYFAPAGHPDPYVVWQETGEDSSLEADNVKASYALTGSIDLYTKTEFDPFIDSIFLALNTAGIGFALESVQYEDDTKYIHYTWTFWV